MQSVSPTDLSIVHVEVALRRIKGPSLSRGDQLVGSLEASGAQFRGAALIPGLPTSRKDPLACRFPDRRRSSADDNRCGVGAGMRACCKPVVEDDKGQAERFAGSNGNGDRSSRGSKRAEAVHSLWKRHQTHRTTRELYAAWSRLQICRSFNQETGYAVAGMHSLHNDTHCVYTPLSLARSNNNAKKYLTLIDSGRTIARNAKPIGLWLRTGFTAAPWSRSRLLGGRRVSPQASGGLCP
jgi:hypothetical protein